MKFGLFALALVAPATADVYFKEQFNDDVSLRYIDSTLKANT